MSFTTCKFGGTSLADANQVKKAADIIKADSKRKYIVVSAPGKRNSKDVKITDMLYLCYQMAQDNLDFSRQLKKVRERYEEIAEELDVKMDFTEIFDNIKKDLEEGTTKDYVASRGEYIMGRFMAEYLGALFVEPAEGIFISGEGRLRSRTYDILGGLLKGSGLFVIPGFYGSGPDNKIKTFSRGGSDITGAIVARASGSELYENWTDVSGFCMTDPRIVPSAKPIKEITYRELRELSYMGATVLHDEAIFPVREVNIPVNIRNTNEPADHGTWIVHSRDYKDTPIVGIAGRKDFSMVFIEKSLMNKTRGFGRRLLSIVESHGISFEHAPTSIDSMCIIMKDEELGDKGEDLLEDIQRVFEPDRVELIKNLALIATVGEGMVFRIGTAAKLFKCLAENKINVRVINQGASEVNIIVGLDNKDFEKAIEVIYNEFV